MAKQTIPRPSAQPDAFVSICQDAKPGFGEDSYCHAFCGSAGMLAVFDGCGGLGAQRHADYSNHSEAYMASRLCAGAFYDGFMRLFPRPADARPPEDAFFANVNDLTKRVLTACKPAAEGDFSIQGSMVKTLPTTAAAAFIRPDANGDLIEAVWAGDSRVYLLTPEGLAQLTTDDTTVPDPMENLYEDGVLRNVLSEGRAPRLHRKRLYVKRPFAVFAATDGCFGYFSTPMEFEGALLETLLSSASPADWEIRLTRALGAVAGDDFTLMLAAYGFRDFAALRGAFVPRIQFLRQNYLSALAELDISAQAPRRQLWQHYRLGYLRYLKDET